MAPERFNLAQYVLARGTETPDRIALAVLGPARAERWSYARLMNAVQSAAGGLLAHGLQPGQRVMLRLGNTAQFPIAYLGAIWAGLVPMPTSAAWTTAEVTRAAQAAGPHAILAGDGIALPDIRDATVLDVSVLEGAPVPVADTAPDNLAYIVFTSGTSGQATPVAHAHRAILARRMMFDGWYGLGPDDRLMHAGAFNWTFTLGTGLLDPWTVGATALVPAEGTGPEALALLAKRHAATLLAGAPGVFRKLLHGTWPGVPTLRHGLCAGEALAPSLRTRWQEATGTDLHEALGMSECSTFLSGSPARPAPQGTCGYPQEGRRLAVLDAEGQASSAGRLAIHRSDPGLMLGYLRDGTPDLPLQGDWFVTADLVERRVDGAFVYRGRADDIITAGGYRIAPVEIEAAFADAPGVTDCAALAFAPKPDTTLLALAYCGPAREADLRRRAEELLAPYKHPKAYRRLDSLPRAGNGKLNRHALRTAWEATP